MQVRRQMSAILVFGNSRLIATLALMRNDGKRINIEAPRLLICKCFTSGANPFGNNEENMILLRILTISSDRSNDNI